MRRMLDRIDDILTTRPLGSACLFFILFCAAVLYAPVVLKIVFFSVGAVLGVVLTILWKKGCLTRFEQFHPLRAAVCLLMAALACLTCFLSYDLFDRSVKISAAREETVDIVFYLDGVVYDSDFSALYTATVRRIDGETVYGVHILAAYEESRPELFTEYCGSCVLVKPEAVSPYFDAASYYGSKGIFAQIDNADECKPTGEEAYTPERLFSFVRGTVASHIDAYTDGNASALQRALLLGDRTQLPDTFKRDFKTLGVSHLLAISGLHLSILFFMVDRLLRRLFLPKGARAAIEILFILAFCALCGFSLSVMRAGLMLILFTAASVLGERSDGLTSLFLSGALIVLFSPFAVFSTAFQLSFLACFGILASAGARKMVLGRIRPGRLRRYLLEPLAVSLGAQIAVLPVILLTYGSFSLAAPVATLILALPVTLILYLAPLCFLISFIPFLSPVVSAVMTLPCNFTVWLASFARYFKEWHLSVDALPALLFCLVLGAALLLFFLAEKRKAAGVLMIAAVAGLAFFSFLAPRFAQPRMITDVNGKNDVLLLYGKGHSAVVDLSDGSGKHLDLCLGLLRERTGELFPDTLILTHYHQRHLSSVERILQNTYLNELLLPAPSEADKEIYLSLVDKAGRYGVDVSVFDQTNALNLDSGISFSELRTDKISRSTHPVFTFSVSCGETDVFFFSSSAWEKFDIPETQRLYFLVHGPIAKKQPDEERLEGHLLFCPDKKQSQTLFGYVVSDDPPPFEYYFT